MKFPPVFDDFVSYDFVRNSRVHFTRISLAKIQFIESRMYVFLVGLVNSPNTHREGERVGWRVSESDTGKKNIWLIKIEPDT